MKKIILTGGPGTGKTSVIKQLRKRGYTCFEEISRAIINEGREHGIDQLFLTNPEKFNQRLFEGRCKQFHDSNKANGKFSFIDRGIPDIIAYNDFKNTKSEPKLLTFAGENRYDYIFMFKPWKEIYRNDSERYETFEQCIEVYDCLRKAYTALDYTIFEMPFTSISERTNYILNIVEYN